MKGGPLPGVLGVVTLYQREGMSGRNDSDRIPLTGLVLLVEVMQLSETVGKDLGDMSRCKEEDNKEEEEFQAKFGARPPSQVCASMWKDLENYRGYHEQGVSMGEGEVEILDDWVSGTNDGIELVSIR